MRQTMVDLQRGDVELLAAAAKFAAAQTHLFHVYVPRTDGTTEKFAALADKLSAAVDAATDPVLAWTANGEYSQIAHVGIPVDGVTFSLIYYPSCYRRGRWRLQIWVSGGPAHHKWGCFDDADQPLRNFHSEANAKDEAEAIARVLLADRRKHGDFAC